MSGGGRFLASDRGAFERTSHPEHGSADTEFSLDARESEILRMVAQGKSNNEIGRALNILSVSVGGHIRALGIKINTRERNEMAKWAQRNGLI